MRIEVSAQAIEASVAMHAALTDNVVPPLDLALASQHRMSHVEPCKDE